MSVDALLLGVDLGTTNCKALLFDLAGRPVSSGSAPTPVRRPRPGWAEHDPDELWGAVVTAIRQALEPIAPARVRAVAVASMGEAGALIDAQGRATGPIIAWYDSRTTAQQRWWMEHIGEQASLAITGIAPAPIYGVFKLMWLREHMPAAYASATRWLPAADYMAFRLCGAQATDYSLACRTMLFDLQRRCWSDDLIARTGIRRDLLPELAPSGTYLGGVSAAAAAATGLAEGTPVGSGGQDHVCGAFAVGVRAAGDCLDSIGTAEAMFLALDTLRLDEASQRATRTVGAHVARDRFYAMDGIWSAGASVEWARAALAWPEGGAYERMEAAAATVPPGSMGVFFLPRLTGGERGAFVGLTTDTGAAALGRAVFEGLCYEWRRCLETAEATLGTHAETINVIGGGARMGLWMRIKADVLGRPLHVLAIEESVALGAALLGGIAAGLYRDEADALAHVRHDERIVAPDPERSAFYDRCYREAYLRIAPALAEVHGAIGSFVYPG